MKKEYFIVGGIAVFACIAVFFATNSKDTQEDSLEFNTEDEYIQGFEDDTLEVPEILNVEEEGIIAFDLIEKVVSENEVDLIKVECHTPFSQGHDEFSENFNKYYENIRVKIINYINFEGYDLALSEKDVFGDEFRAIMYNEDYMITYSDENLISVKRNTTIVSNETEFSKQSCEILSKKDASLILITDISPQAVEKFIEINQATVSSMEDFKYYLTEDGIYIMSSDFGTMFRYDEIDLNEEYSYLGE